MTRLKWYYIMALYSIFRYGSGILYGTSSIIDYIYPNDGPSIGGNNFVITGVNFNPLQWDDGFTDALLDPLKWTDISSGSGSLSTGASHLQLSTGTTVGSVSGISSVAGWVGFQGEVRINIPSIYLFPDSSADLIVYQIRIDSNNYASMRISVDNVGKITLTCEVVLLGSVISSFSTTWTNGLSVIRILRYGEIVYFITNGVIIHAFYGFSLMPIYVRIWSENDPSVSYDVNTIVNEFKYKTFAVFGGRPVHNTTVVSDFRIRGIVVPSIDDKDQFAAYAGPVDVSVVGESPVEALGAYTYYYLDSLRVINSIQSGVMVSFINDNQIKTKDGVKKGIQV